MGKKKQFDHATAPDHLTRINGLGPKSEKLLNKNGIWSFKQLSQTPVAHLREYLDGLPVDPSDWPAAAAHKLERVATHREFVQYLLEHRKELRKEKKLARKALESLIPKLEKGKHGRITGYGVEFKSKGGSRLLPLKYVIQVCVETKLPLEVLKKRKIQPLPQFVNNVPVKIRELRTYHPTAPGPGHEVGNEDLKGGFPVAEANKIDGKFNAGTLGYVVPTSSGPLGIVNHHFATPSRVMIQPPFDHWDKYNTIGHVEKGQFQENPGVDAATIRLSSDARKFEAGIRRFATDSKFVFAGRRLNDDDVYSMVYKFGAKSGSILDEKQTGMITSIDFTVNIENRPFRNIIHVESPRSFNVAGDSGSVLCLDISPSSTSSRKTYLVGGLIFGGSLNSERFGYACHWFDVMQLLDIDIPSTLIREDWTSYKGG